MSQKNVIATVLGISLLSLFSHSVSGAPVRLAETDQSIAIDQPLPVLIDESRLLNIDDVSAQSSRFVMLPLRDIALTEPSAVWIRLELNSVANRDRDWQLLVEGDDIQFATVYVTADKGPGRHASNGTSIVQTGITTGRRLLYKLPRRLDATAPVYVRIMAKTQPRLSLTVWDNGGFAERTIISGLGDPAFGLLLVLAIVGFVVGVVWRDRAVLYMAALCATLLCVLLYADGLAHQTAGLGWLGARTSALMLFVCLSLYFATGYNRYVLEIEPATHWLNRSLSAAQWLLLAAAIASVFVAAAGAPVLIIVVALLGYTVAFAATCTCFWSWRRGNRSAAFLGLAWLWMIGVFGLNQLASAMGSVPWLHGLHVATAGSMLLLVVGYVDQVMGYRQTWVRQLRRQQQTGTMLRVERSRRDFVDEVNELVRTLDPSLYEETILTRFLEYLSSMVPVAGSAVAVSHRGDVRLVVLGPENARDSFESILATREQLLQSVCLSDRAAVIHSDDLGVNPTPDSMSCLGIVPVSANRNDWAGVLLARSGDLEFGRDELDLVCDFAHQAYDALRNAQQFRKVRRQAEIDALTGIYNRRAVIARGARNFKKAQSLKVPLSLLFIDIDHFKLINDEWGHAVGDHALQRVASICNDSLREDDFIGRYGGEEFLAVLPGADASVAEQVAERLRTAVEGDVVKVEGSVLTLTVSVGISELEPKFLDFDTMLRAADRALYRAKREGRNRVVHHRHMLRGDRVSKSLS